MELWSVHGVTHDAVLLTCLHTSLHLPAYLPAYLPTYLSTTQLIVKFEDIDALKLYMSDHHESIMQEFEPKIAALATTALKQQNFVYDDIE